MAFSAGATEPRGVGTPLITYINMIGKKVYVPTARRSFGRSLEIVPAGRPAGERRSDGATKKNGDGHAIRKRDLE